MRGLIFPENAHLIYEDINPAPAISGFNNVPLYFRPMVYKFLAKAVDIQNFNVEAVFSPDFQMIHNRPQLLVMQGQVATIQQQVATVQQQVAAVDANQVRMLARLTTIEQSINELLHHFNIQVPAALPAVIPPGPNNNNNNI